MDIKTLNKKGSILAGIGVGLMLAIFVVPLLANAVFVSSPQDPVLAGDITTLEILDGTITSSDINANSFFNITNLAIGSSTPSAQFSLETSSSTRVFFIGSKGTSSPALVINIATTTQHSFAIGIGTTSPAIALAVQGDALVSGTTTTGSIIATSSTSFGGVTYKWPTTAGVANNALLTDGSGGLSWGSTGGSTRVASTTDRSGIFFKLGKTSDTTSTTMVKMKEYDYVGPTGSLGVSWERRSGGSGTTCTTQVYVNAVATSTADATLNTTQTFVTKTVDYVVSGDNIAIFGKNNEGTDFCRVVTTEFHGVVTPGGGTNLYEL